MPIAPCTACAIGATMAAASLVRALATAARRRRGNRSAPTQPSSAAMRAANTCSAITASWCWIAWNLPIERPNWTRWPAYATVSSSARCIAPASCAAASIAPASIHALPLAAGRSRQPAGQRRSARRLACTPVSPRSAASHGSRRQPSSSGATTTQSADTAVRRAGTRQRAVVPDPRTRGDRDRARRRFDPRTGEHRAHQHRLRQRHRQRVPAFGDEQKEGIAQRQAGAAGRFGRERIEEAGRLDPRPQRRGRAALLDRPHHGRWRRVGEQALERLDAAARSSQPQPARDHAAQDLARAAAQRERRRDLRRCRRACAAAAPARRAPARWRSRRRSRAA